MQLTNSEFYQEIKLLLHNARSKICQTINTTMTETYYQIGSKIVEREQGGKTRVKYGKGLLKDLSLELTEEFGKGFSVRNLEQMRKFYLCFQKLQTVSTKFKLSWSHYIFLTRISNKDERDFYEIESVQNSWNLRELKRQFDSGLFERLRLSSNKNRVKELASNEQIIQNIEDMIKDPYILEFVGLPELSGYSESELEQKLIDKLEHFLLELKKGIFRNIYKNAEDNPSKNFYIVIDEINRGNISKIFGELITLIEEDKRDTYEVTLPYSKESFKVPSNLYIIATMNSTDKSIATIDIALRRRFTFLKMKPNSNLVNNTDAKELMEKLNIEIEKRLGEDYMLGHSYFMSKNIDLEFVKEYKIKPLLEEYFYADDKMPKEIIALLKENS